MVHIAYAQHQEGAFNERLLRFAEGSAGSWQIETITQWTTPTAGYLQDAKWRTSIVAGLDGTTWIALPDGTDYGVSVWSNQGGTWARSFHFADPLVQKLVDAIGQRTDMTVGVDGSIYLAFEEDYDDKMYVATWRGGTWTFEAIEQNYGVGGWCSLVVTPKGVVHLLYQRAGMFPELLFATNANGTWQRFVPVFDWTTSHPFQLLMGSDGALYAFATPSVPTLQQMFLSCPQLDDAIDRDCDGVDGTDRDRDGHLSLETGGDDCDDTREDVFPGTIDVPGDGLDADCSGSD
jgi:hypothetical protein